MRPIPHRAHKKFVETEGWEKKSSSGTQKTGDHPRYTLRLATGDVLYTRVSHGSGSLDDLNTVAAVLRDQLQVSEEDFWRCVSEGVLPLRPKLDEPERPEPGIDASLLRNLVRKVGLSAQELEGMTQERAVEVWQDWLINGAPG